MTEDIKEEAGMIHSESGDKLEIRYEDLDGFFRVRWKILDALLLDDGPVFVRIYPRYYPPGQGDHARYKDSGQASFFIARQKDGMSYILSEFLCIREYIEVLGRDGESATREDLAGALNTLMFRYLGF